VENDVFTLCNLRQAFEERLPIDRNAALMKDRYTFCRHGDEGHAFAILPFGEPVQRRCRAAAVAAGLIHFCARSISAPMLGVAPECGLRSADHSCFLTNLRS
jgi:hypothetical protein